MKKPNYIFWIGLSEAVGALSGFLSRGGMERYMRQAEASALTPPGWVFAVVWTVLYALMGIGAAMVEAALPGRDRSAGLNLFAVQLTVNFFWSLIFFNAAAYGFALLWLLLLRVLVLGMIPVFYRVDKTAALLQIPYFLWLTFAAYLNYAAWQLNR